MKKILILILLICPTFSYGASNVSMTTYYPVPSAIYSEVKADTASLSSGDGAVLQIGSSSSHTVVLDVAGFGTFEGKLEIADSNHTIYTQISKDLNVNKTSTLGGSYNVLVQNDGGLYVVSTTNFYSVVNANVGSGTGFFLQDLTTDTTDNDYDPNNITTFYGDTWIEGTLSVDNITMTSPDSFFAFFPTGDVNASWENDGYNKTGENELKTKFPMLPDAEVCGGITPALDWILWNYQTSAGPVSLNVLALTEVCNPTGGGGGGSIPGGGTEFIKGGGESRE